MANAHKTIGRNAFLLTISNLLNGVLAFFLVVAMARYLGDVVFGMYSFALSFVGFFTVVSDMGLGVWLTREVARHKKNAAVYLSNVIFLRGLLSVISFVLILLFVWIIGYKTPGIVYLVGLYSIVETSAMAYRSIFRAHEKMAYDAIVQVFYRIITVCSGLYVLLNGGGISALLNAFLLCSIIYVGLTYYLGSRNFTYPRFSIDIPLCKKMLRESLPFAITGLLVTLYFRIDVVMLSLIKGDQVVGWYGAAYTMIYALIFIPQSFTESVFPKMAQNFKKSMKKLNILYVGSMRFMAMIAIPMVVGTILVAGDLVTLVYSIDYSGSIVAVKLLSVALGVMFLNHVLWTTLNAVNKQHIHTYVALVCAVLNIGLNLIWIPLFGVVGASISTIITEILIFIVLYFYLRSYVAISLVWVFVRPLISALMMGFVIYHIPAHFGFQIILGLIVYLLIMYLLKGITSTDVMFVRNILKRN